MAQTILKLSLTITLQYATNLLPDRRPTLMICAHPIFLFRVRCLTWHALLSDLVPLGMLYTTTWNHSSGFYYGYAS